MSELLIGVIGSGGRGDIARYAHKPGQGSRVVACCDLDPDVLAQQRERYGNDIFTTSDYHELLAQDIDAVFICTPDYLHEAQAMAALEQGKAVYLEKPMAISIQGCDRILTTAAQKRGRLYLGHNMRHMRFVLEMKALIDSGAIGEVKTAWCRHFVGHGGDYYFKDWHAERRLSTGLLLQKATHDIDVLHWLCGAYSKHVQAFGALMLYDQVAHRQQGPEVHRQAVSIENWPPLSQTHMHPEIEVEDVSLMNMVLSNGVLASYQQCHFTPDYWRNYTIIGSEGRLENFGDIQPGAVIKVWNKRVWGYAPEADERIDVGVQGANHGGADARIVSEFVRFAKEGGAVTTSPLAARYSVAAGCAATASLRQGGQPHEVPVLDPAVAAYFAA